MTRARARSGGGFLYTDEDVLAGVTLALRNVDREMRKEWARAMRTTGTTVWRSAVTKRQYLPQDKMFRTASIAWSMTGKGTAKVGIRPLSGGAGGPGAPGGLVVDFGDKDGRYGDTSGPAPFTRYDRSGRVVYAALVPFGRWFGQMALATVADLIREATYGD